MDSKFKQYGFIGLAVAVLGAVLSFVLVLEYFGSAGSIGSGLCGAMGDPGSCQRVAESSYSAIRGVPGVGDIPVALLGFSFYGAMAFGFFRLANALDEVEFHSVLNLITPFAILGILVDLVLLLVSVTLIGTICALCFLTYIVTGVILAILVIARRKVSEAVADDFVKGIKKQFANYAIAFLAFFSVGLALGKSLSAGPAPIASSDGSEEIAFYEAQGTFQIDTTGAASLGNPNAPIVIVKYADFNCGHCMHASHILSQVLSEFDGMVKVVYMNFPLDGNCNRLVGRQSPGASSCVAATASLCGDKLGKFKEIYTGIYADNENGVMHSTASVLNVASKSGVDMGKFRACMGSGEVQKQLMKEIDEAEKLRIQSTPSLFINGKPLQPGTPDPRALRKLLVHLVKKA